MFAFKDVSLLKEAHILNLISEEKFEPTYDLPDSE
jgi:hypothetical protein